MSADTLEEILDHYGVSKDFWRGRRPAEESGVSQRIIALAKEGNCKEAMRECDGGSRRFSWGVSLFAAADCFARRGDFKQAVVCYTRAVDEAPSPRAQFEFGCWLLARCTLVSKADFACFYPIAGGDYVVGEVETVASAKRVDHVSRDVEEGEKVLRSMESGSLKDAITKALQRYADHFRVSPTQLHERFLDGGRKFAEGDELPRLAVKALGRALCGFHYDRGWAGPRDEAYWAACCQIALGVAFAVVGGSDSAYFMYAIQSDEGWPQDRMPAAIVLSMFGRPLGAESYDTEEDVRTLIDFYFEGGMPWVWPWLTPETRRLLADAEIQLALVEKRLANADSAIISYTRALEAQVKQLLEDLFKPSAAPPGPKGKDIFSTLMNWSLPNGELDWQTEFEQKYRAVLAKRGLEDSASFLLEELPSIWHEPLWNGLSLGRIRVMKAAHGYHRGRPAELDQAQLIKQLLLAPESDGGKQIVPRLAVMAQRLSQTG
jgi:tetratricopeptide (TPR) repeat protein